MPRFTALSAASKPLTAPLPNQPVDADPALSVTQLSKAFGKHQAVEEISFELPRGKTLGIVGESGSGKTTTARMVLGLQKPDDGSVQLLGEHFAPAHESQRRKLRQQMGAIYQNPLGIFSHSSLFGGTVADRCAQPRHVKARRRVPQGSGRAARTG